ncbi:MAG: vitamin K epoxide reductase family protein [Acidobacteriota bacterium]
MKTTRSDGRTTLILLILLASAAAGISLMLTSYHLSEGREPWALFKLACDSEKGGCADVLASPWATGPGGIPTALFGAVYFGALALWYLVVGRPRGAGRRWQAVPLGINLAGALVSLFLASVMLGRLHEICWWCTLSHLINFALLFLAWKLFRRGGAEGDGDGPPRRLGAAGVLLMVAWAVLCIQGLAVSNLRKSAQRASDYARTYYEDVDLQRYLQQRAASAAVPVRPDDPVRGNPAAAHTAVVFSDFQCPGCRAFAQFSESELLPALGDRLRIVYKHYPLNRACNPGLGGDVHPNACEAAEAAEAARQIGGGEAFWKMHDALFQNQDSFGSAPWASLTQKIGLDPAAVIGQIGARAHHNRIVEDTELGRKLGIGSTPTIFLDGRKMEDWNRLELWQALVN